MTEVYIVIKECTYQYYLLKVVRRGFDVYCFIPNLGTHHSLHRSGEAHFRYEGKVAKPREEPPVALIMGEAGTPIKNGIRSTSLCELGRAIGICTAIFSITSLIHDFRKFKRGTVECFTIDTELLLEDTKAVEVGIWAVPARNEASFEFNNPGIPEDLLYKIAQCEPQVWIYARPL